MDLTGGEIGPYEVESLIGTGGFATVYRAHDRRLRDTVAIKILADNHALDPDVRARFIDEGHVLRRIESVHVLQVYDIGETVDGRPYLVLAHADRGDLQTRVVELRAQGWRASSSDALHLASVLAEALEAVHAERVVHRDVAPSNLLLRSQRRRRPADDVALVRNDERLVVSDLGFAKDLAANSGLTVGGGTSGFRAPEQLRAVGTVDQRADVYSATAVMVWLLTGQPPGVARSELLAAECSPELIGALERGLHDDPEQRPSEIGQWRAEVTAALTHPDAIRRKSENIAPPPATPASLEPQATPATPADEHRPPSASGNQGGVPPEPVPADTGYGNAAPPGGAASRSKWLAALVAVAAVSVGAFLIPKIGDSDTRSVSLSDGRVRSSVDTDGAELSVTGFQELRVGATARFEVAADGVTQWTWVAPDGARYADEEELLLTPTSAGDSQISVVGMVDASGERLEVEFDIVVID